MGSAPRKAVQQGRYRFLLVLMVGMLLAVAGRLTYLQIIAAPALAQDAADQRTRDIELAPRRGSIYDREGQPCFQCQAPIRRRVIGQRSSYYCPRCQK